MYNTGYSLSVSRIYSKVAELVSLGMVKILRTLGNFLERFLH